MNNEDRNSQERFDRALDRAENLRDEQRNAIHARVLARGDEDHMIGPTYLAATATVAMTEHEAGRIMQSAHALCPSDLSHPEKMRWMAKRFIEKSGIATVAKDGGEVEPMLQYDNHDGSTTFKQYAKDALPGWAKNVRPYVEASPKPEASAEQPAGYLYGNSYYERENPRTTEHIKQHGRPLYAAPTVPGEPT